MLIKDNPDTFQIYLSDASNFKGDASKVYIPSNYQEFKHIVSTLYQHKTPFTISGAGTGLTGGRVPYEGAIISTESLNKILDIDYNKGLATVQPGLLLVDLQEELNNNGYFFPPNPTENNSSIGGNIAVNASGSRSFKYGAYREFVQQLKLITASGDEIILERGTNYLKNNKVKLTSLSGEIYSFTTNFLPVISVKNASAYFLRKDMDLIDLFIGSEGTLAVISEIKLKIIKKPEKVIGFMFFFNNVDKMLKYVDKVRILSRENNKKAYQNNNEISARLIELFDENTLNILSDKYTQIPEKAKACIWIEQELNSNNQDRILEKWNNLIIDYSDLANETWVSLSEKEHTVFREFRHEIPLRFVDIVAENNFRKVGTDTAVPVSNFVEFYNFVVDILEKSHIEFAIWGHIGDCHLHANLLPKTKNEFDKSLEIYNLIIAQAISLGGTVSAEHGIGKIKKKYLKSMYGEEAIELMKNIKLNFDKYNLLGRGNLFDI